MLSGGDKLFSRQMTKKAAVKALNLSKQISQTSITTTAVLSSRRARTTSFTPGSPFSPLLPPEEEEEREGEGEGERAAEPES